MAIRVRKDGTIVCAAMTEPEDGDTYIDDAVHGYLDACSENSVHLLLPSETHDQDGLWFFEGRVPPGYEIVYCNKIGRRVVRVLATGEGMA